MHIGEFGCYERGRNSKDVKFMAIARKLGIAAAALALGATSLQSAAKAEEPGEISSLLWLTSAIAALYLVADLTRSSNQRPVSP